MAEALDAQRDASFELSRRRYEQRQIELAERAVPDALLRRNAEREVALHLHHVRCCSDDEAEHVGFYRQMASQVLDAIDGLFSDDDD